MRTEFEHWHSHEHFPERLGIPGFLRATRWISANGGEGIFVLYELEAHGVVSSPAYLASLAAYMADWVRQPGPAGAHLLRHETPAIAKATEEKIRGADQAADWVLVVCAYDAAALDALAQSALSEASLVSLGARPGPVCGRFALSLSATREDIR